ncbi:hypothetical protein [Paenarthrobacter nicotinovorans]|uniref:hypothetical protein n=1 Tax=Paenarthrobacter nicotinovorans TaxID=29320 RepID=UPI003D66B6E7
MPADGQARDDGKNTFADDLIEPLPTIAGGQVKVPTDPGLCNSLDPDAVERYRVSDDYRVLTQRDRLTFHTGTAGNRTYGKVPKTGETGTRRCSRTYSAMTAPPGSTTYG